MPCKLARLSVKDIDALTALRKEEIAYSSLADRANVVVTGYENNPLSLISNRKFAFSFIEYLDSQARKLKSNPVYAGQIFDIIGRRIDMASSHLRKMLSRTDLELSTLSSTMDNLALLTERDNADYERQEATARANQGIVKPTFPLSEDQLRSFLSTGE
jgi:hypothetical protein